MYVLDGLNHAEVVEMCDLLIEEKKTWAGRLSALVLLARVVLNVFVIYKNLFNVDMRSVEVCVWIHDSLAIPVVVTRAYVACVVWSKFSRCR